MSDTEKYSKQVKRSKRSTQELDPKGISSKQSQPNKVSLSCFDDKRFILEDGISTLPHGHYLIRDVGVTHDIMDDPEWGNEEMPGSPTWDELAGNDPLNTVSQLFPEEIQNAQNQPVSPQYHFEYAQDDEDMSLTQQMMEEWSPPDPGLYQRTYSDSELEEGVVDLDAEVEEQSPERNPFIIDEATEAEEEEVDEEEGESSENDCVVVAQLTEDERNAIEDLEYLIDFDNWFSDDEFVNRLKRAKRRRMRIEDDSESE